MTTEARKTMTEQPESVPAESGSGRVLVLLDGSRLSLAALEAAADIAALRGHEVLGVFVEEVNLLRSSGFDFAREIGASSGATRPLDSAMLEMRMRALAEQARRSLQRAVASRGLRQALKLCRGSVVEEVLRLAGPEDLVVMGRVGWSAMPGSRLGSTARGLIRQAPGDVLLWAEIQRRPGHGVVVLLNDDQGANHRALNVGIEQARRHHQPLTVLVRSHGEGGQEVVRAIEEQLIARGAGARVRLIPRASAAEVARLLRRERPAELVVSRQCSVFDEQGADQLLIELNLPVTVTP
jgi:nucleotide-binding universal stress UspA family protein